MDCGSKCGDLSHSYPKQYNFYHPDFFCVAIASKKTQIKKGYHRSRFLAKQQQISVSSDHFDQFLRQTPF